MKGTVAALTANRRVEPREFPVPEIGDHEILLGIGLTGVCGSDLPRFQDIQKTLDLDVPVVMGHEISGRVLKRGRRASESMRADGELREGDRVVVYSQRPCGQCHWCREQGAARQHGDGRPLRLPRADRPHPADHRDSGRLRADGAPDRQADQGRRARCRLLGDGQEPVLGRR